MTREEFVSYETPEFKVRGAGYSGYRHRPVFQPIICRQALEWLGLKPRGWGRFTLRFSKVRTSRQDRKLELRIDHFYSYRQPEPDLRWGSPPSRPVVFPMYLALERLLLANLPLHYTPGEPVKNHKFFVRLVRVKKTTNRKAQHRV